MRTQGLPFSPKNFQISETELNESILIGDPIRIHDESKGNIASVIDEIQTTERLIEFLEIITGPFAIITKLGGDLTLVTDPIASIPLYFYESDEDVNVSTTQRFIQNLKREDLTRNDAAYSEFLTLGFVTGNESIFHELSQVAPGQIVRFTSDETEIFEYFSWQSYQTQKTVSHEDLDKVLSDVFERVIARANGRTILTGLSGGYDTRILVTKLLEFGYDDIVTYTYGVEGNPEAKLSKQVAKSFDVDWYIVNRTPKTIRSFFQSDLRKDYDSLFKYTHTPSFFNLQILNELFSKDEFRELSDYYFITGHLSNFLTKARVHNEFVQKGAVSTDEVIDRLTKMYKFNEHALDNNLIKDRIKFTIDTKISESNQPEIAIGQFEYWEWMEYQSKHIANSIHAADFFGLEWSLPFADREYLEFWADVSYSQRKNRQLYEDYVDKKYNEVVDDPVGQKIADNKTKKIYERGRVSPIYKLIPSSVINSPLNLIIQPLYHLYNNITTTPMDVYHSDYAGRFYIIPEERFPEIYNGEKHYRSYRIQELLGEVEF